MVGNCEKMTLISSTTNEWPQNNQQQLLLHAQNLIPSPTNTFLMEKPVPQPHQPQQQQQQQQQQVLKCPRCDSSNTKFCYYNNYSLSQPRHFCKACKRYWTRGGTLRNVPVGGGCRKNKRVKKSSSTSSTTTVAAATATTTAETTVIDNSPSSSSAPTLVTIPSSTTHSHMDHITPFLYGSHSNIINRTNVEPLLSFPRFTSRVDTSPVFEYDLHSQVNNLGFSSPAGLITSDHISSKSSLLSSYPFPVFGSSGLSTNPSHPIMASSLIPSNIGQEKATIISANSRNVGGNLNNNFLGFSAYEDMQLQGNGNRMNQLEPIGVSSSSSSDPNNNNNNNNNSLLWNANGAWLDPGANIGSSVPSLI